MPTVLLATFPLMPDGEPGADLIAPLDAHGIEARWVLWDDPRVEWDKADLVVARSTWDYSRRWPEFTKWVRRVSAESVLLNGPALFAWNADKSYLQRLGERVPTVPTGLLDDGDLVARLAEELARWGQVVIKPRIGAGGRGLVRATATDDPALVEMAPGPWIIQPLVESIQTMGERSVFVFDGAAVCQVDKHPGPGEIRVHEMYGGSSRQQPVDPQLAAVASAAVDAAAEITGHRPSYARVDLMHWQGEWVLSELELIEPGLYLDVAPENADRFATLVATTLRRVRP